MGIFGNLTDDGLEKTEDRVGGGYQPFDSDIYLAKIKTAYAIKSDGGAHGVVLTAEANGREYRETLWVTNKKGENFYLNKNDQTKKVPLPGYATMNQICLVTTDKPLSQQDTAEKVINVYDPALSKEVPKSVDMLVDLLGKELYLAIGQSLTNKSEKQGDTYVAIADTRIENSIEAVFHHPTKMTVNEASSENPTAGFYDAWLARNQGQQRDRRTIKDGANSGSGAPSAGASPAPKKSIFDQQ